MDALLKSGTSFDLFIYLFFSASETWIALMTCLQKKGGPVGFLSYQPLTFRMKAVRYFTLMCLFLWKKKKKAYDLCVGHLHLLAVFQRVLGERAPSL